MSTIESTNAAVLPAGTWQLDPVHSQVGFAVKYMVGTFRGSFSPVAATLSVADGVASLTGEAKAENVRVQEPNLVSHLLAPDFFDAERTPDLRFSSSDVRGHPRIGPAFANFYHAVMFDSQVLSRQECKMVAAVATAAQDCTY